MIPAERQHIIQHQLANRDVMSIAELAQLLDVSHMTIRRDIQHLEQEGRVKSVSGGVRLPERLALEPSHIAKTEVQQSEKAGIGFLAASLVPKDALVYLDAGTTTLQIAKNLLNRSDLTIVTNDFAISSYLLANSGCTLYHTGGEVDRQNQSSVGQAAAEAIMRFNFGIAFISTSSWTINGLSTPAEQKVPVKKAAARSAARSVLVCDSSKYGIVAPINALPLDALDVVVTDHNLPDSVVSAIRAKNVEVMLAGAADEVSTPHRSPLNIQSIAASNKEL